MSIKLKIFINHVFVGVFQYHPRAPKLEVAIGCTVNCRASEII